MAPSSRFRDCEGRARGRTIPGRRYQVPAGTVGGSRVRCSGEIPSSPAHVGPCAPAPRRPRRDRVRTRRLVRPHGSMQRGRSG